MTHGGCLFWGDYNGAPLERSGSCDSGSGSDTNSALSLNNKAITSVKIDSFAGMGGCT